MYVLTPKAPSITRDNKAAQIELAEGPCRLILNFRAMEVTQLTSCGDGAPQMAALLAVGEPLPLPRVSSRG